MRKMIVAIACLFLFLAPIHAQTKTQHPVLTQVMTPEDGGFSSERLRRIDNVMKEYVDQEKMNGAVGMIVHDGKIVYYKNFGYDENKRSSLKKDAIFRIASQTKAITSVAVMMLYEEGKFMLDDPIS